MKPTLLALLLFLLSAYTCMAQDIIIKKNNEQIKAKIVEIGPDEVKFKYYNLPDGPTIVMKKSDIKTIKLEGENESVVIDTDPDPMSVNNDVIENKTSSIKFHFFSPLRDHLAFSYEWMVKPGFNWETGLGIVGPGISVSSNLLNDDPKGVFIRTGPKFLLGNSSDIQIDGARYAHPLKGRYFKVEAVVYALSRTYTRYNMSGTEKVKNSYQGAAFNLIYGRQYIFGNMITAGWYIGGGYGFENYTSTYVPVNGNNYYDFDPRRYSHSYFGKNIPITLTSGFNLGYIFKTPEWVENLSHGGKMNVPPSRQSMKKR
jgi:hypothetical protein